MRELAQNWHHLYSYKVYKLEDDIEHKLAKEEDDTREKEIRYQKGSDFPRKSDLN